MHCLCLFRESALMKSRLGFITDKEKKFSQLVYWYYDTEDNDYLKSPHCLWFYDHKFTPNGNTVNDVKIKTLILLFFWWLNWENEVVNKCYVSTKTHIDEKCVYMQPVWYTNCFSCFLSSALDCSILQSVISVRVESALLDAVGGA